MKAPLLSLTLALTLIGCGGGSGGSSNDTPPTSSSAGSSSSAISAPDTLSRVDAHDVRGLRFESVVYGSGGTASQATLTVACSGIFTGYLIYPNMKTEIMTVVGESISLETVDYNVITDTGIETGLRRLYFRGADNEGDEAFSFISVNKASDEIVAGESYIDSSGWVINKIIRHADCD